MYTDEVEYLSITISATCDNCGNETDDAEGDRWTTNPQYTKFQCSECQEQVQEVVMIEKDEEQHLRELFGIV